MNRFVIDTIFIGLFFMLPFWLVAIFGIFVFFRVRFVWYELVILGFMADLVSGVFVLADFLYIPVYTVGATGVYLISLVIRKRMSAYA